MNKKPANQSLTNRVGPVGVWNAPATETRRSSIVREFALNTSTHALPGIARSRSHLNRIFWSISFLVFTAIMSYFVTQTIIQYFQYPTQTSVTIEVESSQLFPAVTVCNYSPVRSDILLADFFNYTDSLNITSPNQPRKIDFRNAPLIRQYLIEKVNTNQSIIQYLFSLENIMISCKYNYVACASKDFIAFESSNHGLCYTFNARTKHKNISSIKTTIAHGGYGLLQLRLYAHIHLYVPVAAGEVSSGMVAMIHDNTELPRIDIAGIHLTTGRKHKLGFKKRVTQFLPAPYSDCIQNAPSVMKGILNRYTNADYTYSQEVCYQACQQAYTYKKCGCIDPYDWVARWIVMPRTDQIILAPLCNLTDRCYPTTVQELSENPDLWNEYCSQCEKQCRSVDFVMTLSAADAPAEVYAYQTKLWVENSSLPLSTNWTSNWPIEISKNYVALDVVFQSKMVETFSQDASMSPVDVLSNVGGHTGLWIGISFLSIMEFIEMLYRLSRHEIRLLYRRFFGSIN